MKSLIINSTKLSKNTITAHSRNVIKVIKEILVWFMYFHILKIKKNKYHK